MKKLITIPDEIVEPLRIMAVKNKISFHALIIEVLRDKVSEAHKASSFLK